MRLPRILLSTSVLLSMSCRTGQVRASYAVLPATPAYLVRSPEGVNTPFPGLLSRYGNFVPGQGWIDLRPDMELRVENAYYEPGSPKRGLNGFLGTETALYRFGSDGGLRLVSVQPMENRPADQEPVQRLINAAQQAHQEYRFFFEITFPARVETRGSVLIGGASGRELEQATQALLADPSGFCAANRDSCTVFPVACSVSVELPVYVDGERRFLPWSTTLAKIVPPGASFTLRRMHNGRLIPVRIDRNDKDALAIPLLPDDHVGISRSLAK